MATINLYNFQKRQNSTKQPTGTGLTKTGEFNTPLDVLHPSITVQDPGSIISSGYNYAYITSLGRYYWIDRITALSASLCQLDMSVDVLASYKTDIGSSSHYILRCASFSNGDVADYLYPLESSKHCETDSISSIPWYQAGGYNLSDGWYIIGINNADSGAVGSTSFYALNEAAFQELRYNLFSSTTWTQMQFSQIEPQLYKSLFNPMQYIVSCMWFPVKPDTTGTTTVSQLSMGFFDADPFTNVASECFKMNGMTLHGSFDLAEHTHPLASTRGRYLNKTPFLTRTLYIPVVGSIELDTGKIIGTSALPTIYWHIDFISGEARIQVICNQNDGALVGEGCGQLGINVSLAQQTQDIVGFGAGIATAFSGGMSGIFGLLTGNGSEVGNGIASAASGIASAASALAPNVSSLPGNASLICGDILPLDVTSYVFPVNDDNTDRGRPYCEIAQISTMSGYIMCGDANISFSKALRPEQDMIINYLNGGFFYE